MARHEASLPQPGAVASMKGGVRSVSVRPAQWTAARATAARRRTRPSPGGCKRAAARHRCGHPLSRRDANLAGPDERPASRGSRARRSSRRLPRAPRRPLSCACCVQTRTLECRGWMPRDDRRGSLRRGVRRARWQAGRRARRLFRQAPRARLSSWAWSLGTTTCSSSMYFPARAAVWSDRVRAISASGRCAPGSGGRARPASR